MQGLPSLIPQPKSGHKKYHLPKFPWQLTFLPGVEAAWQFQNATVTLNPAAQINFSSATCEELWHQIVLLKDTMQLQVALMVACVSSFLEPPRLQVSYTLANGQQCNQSLRLPLTVNKFCVAPDNAIPADMFFTRWRSLAGGCHFPCTHLAASDTTSWLLLRVRAAQSERVC